MLGDKQSLQAPRIFRGISDSKGGTNIPHRSACAMKRRYQFSRDERSLDWYVFFLWKCFCIKGHIIDLIAITILAHNSIFWNIKVVTRWDKRICKGCQLMHRCMLISRWYRMIRWMNRVLLVDISIWCTLWSLWGIICIGHDNLFASAFRRLLFVPCRWLNMSQIPMS